MSDRLHLLWKSTRPSGSYRVVARIELPSTTTYTGSSSYTQVILPRLIRVGPLGERFGKKRRFFAQSPHPAE